MEKITCLPYDWYEEDDLDNFKLSINAWCLDRESNPVLVRFQNFLDKMIIELPIIHNGRPMRWTKESCRLIFYALQKKLDQHAPVEHVPVQSRKLYYYKEDGNKVPVIKLFFSTRKAIWECKKLLKYPLYVEGLGRLTLTPRAYETDSIRQFLTVVGSNYAQWFSAHGNLVQSEHRISTLEREYCVQWDQIQPIDESESSGWITHPKILSYDIESYSDNPNMLPVRSFASHVCYMISCTFQSYGLPETRKRYLIIMGDCENLDNAEVVRVGSEEDLCLAFTNLIKKEDPDLVMTYNGFIFDDSYLNARLERKGLSWDVGGSRLIGKPPTFVNKSWSSKQSKVNILEYIHFPGRINIDMYGVVRKNQKLPIYRLSYVAQKFLNDDKHDVHYKEMFRIYEMQSKAIKGLTNCIRQWVPKEDDEVLNPEQYISSCLKYKPLYHSNISNDVIQEVVSKYEEAKNEMTRVSAYCVQDSDLVIDLFEYFNEWIGLIELSNAVNVRIFDIYTRGQQLRGLSLLYDLLEKHNAFMDSIEQTDKSKFQGAYVGNPIPGKYPYVATLDFNSLYPSIIMAYNICYSTYIPSSVILTQEEEEKYHVIPVSSEHDIEYIDGDEENDPPGTETLEKYEEIEDVVDEETGMGRIERTMRRKIRVTRIHRYKKVEVIWIPEHEATDRDKSLYEEVEHEGSIYYKKVLYEGFVPRLVRRLVDTRKLVKKQIKEIGDDDPVMSHILDKRQWALKICANSIYGMLGIKEGRLPFRQGAESVTAKGRELIEFSNKYLEDNYNATVVYGDTDSTMYYIPGIDDGQKCVEMAKKLEKEISALLPDPLYLEFEKAAKTFLIAPKKYIMWKYDPYPKKKNKNGEWVPNPGYGVLYDKEHKDAWLIKGVILARRDNCMWQRGVYHRVLDNIMEDKSYEETTDLIISECLKMLYGKINYSELIIIKGLGASYKDENYHMKVFADHLKSIGKPPTPGSRLEYLVVSARDEATKLGNKMRAPETFLERLESEQPEPIDKIYYLHNVLKNCIEQLYQVGYQKELKKMKELDLTQRYTHMINELVANGHQPAMIPYWSHTGGNVIETMKLLFDPSCPISGPANEMRKKYLKFTDIFHPRLTEKLIDQLIRAYQTNQMKEFIRRRASPQFTSKYEHLFEVKST